jgi:hypothetical protein
LKGGTIHRRFGGVAEKNVISVSVGDVWGANLDWCEAAQEAARNRGFKGNAELAEQFGINDNSVEAQSLASSIEAVAALATPSAPARVALLAGAPV